MPDEIQNVLTAVNDYYRTQEVGAGWKFSEVNYDARRNGAVDIYISIPKELNLTLSQWQAFCPNQYEVDFWSAVKGLEVYMYFVPLHSGEWGGTECPHPVL
ncbi:MAG: hypothetical protein R3332_08390 [Pseudohongiellaceae bacterium]|nr:hypothetical protein [Pseudohongiellaceae bacterium]